MIHAALLLILAAAALAQQVSTNACSVVTQQDAVSLLGPKAVKHENAGSCAWDVPGQHLVFVVIVDSRPEAKQQIQLPRTMVTRAGGTVRDEPTVGAGAYSTTIKGVQTIYVLRGNTAASITVTNDGFGVLPDQLEKMRPVAKRIAGKL